MSRRRTWTLIAMAIAALIVSMAGSIHKNFIQVNIGPMADDLTGGDVSQFAWSTTTFALLTSLTSPIAGYIADRWGAGRALLLGAVISGVLFAAYGIAPSFFVFFPLYGAVGALAFGLLSFAPLAVLVDRMYTGSRKGLTYAALTNGPALGFIVLAPLWVLLAETIPWQSVSLAIGVGFLIVATPLALYIQRAIPQPTDEQAPATPSLLWSLKQLVTSMPYMVLMLAFTGCGISMAFIDVHMVPALQIMGVAPVSISASFIVLGITEIIGSLVAGYLCDRGWVKGTLLAGYALRALSLLVLFLAPNDAGSIVFGGIFGISYLMTVIATTIWVLKVVPDGAKGLGTGALWTLHAIGAAVSSQVGATVATDIGYTATTVTTAFAAVASFILIVVLPKSAGAPAANDREPARDPA